VPRNAMMRLVLSAALCSLCVGAMLFAPMARASTSYVDGISDQSIPSWDGAFGGSWFAGYFASTWVTGGHIKLARYVVQWNVMSGSYAGSRALFENWLDDVAGMGLTPEVALTSYDGTYPASSAQYTERLEQLLNQAKTMGHAIRYVEPWNEPNNQGNETAVAAAHFTNSAYSTCEKGYGCTVVAGNLEDIPGKAYKYEEEYIKNLSPVPTIWGFHPYYSVQEKSESPLLELINHLPGKGSGAQIWITEIAARKCSDFGGHFSENGEIGQAERASWLVNTLIPNRKPEHVFYYEFLLGERKAPSSLCESGGEDDALYLPSSDPNASDSPRPAASYIFDNKSTPWAFTGGYSALDATQATVSGSVYSGGFLATKYYFQYGTSPSSYNTATPEGEAGAGTGGVTRTATITGLAEGTTYYYRAVSTNSSGTSYGTGYSFKTLRRPTVTTKAATGVVETQVTLNGSVNPNELDTHYYFEYGLSTSGYEHDVPAIPGKDIGSGTNPELVSATITGLTKHTTYHYRLVASNGAGISEGGSEGFATYDTFVGQPSAVAQTNGTVDVFGRLANNELGHDWYINGQWNGAENFVASMASEPSAVQSSAGVLDVFWQGTDDNLWHVWYTPGVGWNAPQDLGMGPLGGAPHAVGQSNGDVDVFWKGTSSSNYGLYHASYSPSTGWSGPESVGGAPLGSEPAPVVTEPGVLDVYWEGESKSNYGLYHMWYTPSTKTWNGPQALAGAPLGSPPAPASPLNGNVDVFWAGATSSLWSDWYTASSRSWSGPLDVGG
jgi:hypothetical protein